MYQQKIYSLIKTEIIKRLEETELNNFSDFENWVLSNFKIINSLNEVPLLASENSNSSEETKEEPTKEGETSEESEYPIGQSFTFTKKASGGLIEGINYPIPEDLVRAMYLENGNKVTIESVRGFFDHGSPIYDFFISDRTKIDNPGLCEIKQGIVTLIDDKPVVLETTSGPVVDENGNEIILSINDKDQNKQGIDEGDIIDGRYYTNNISNSFRVTHKYDLEDSEVVDLVEKKKLNFRKNNKSTNEELSDSSMLPEVDKELFAGNKILLVGLGSRISDFNNYLEKAKNITMTHLTGDEHKQRIRAQILKADIVLVSTRENSHDTSYYVSRVCNEYDIPFTSTYSDGFKSIMLDAESLLTSL